MTIRVLGGLLSAHYLSSKPPFSTTGEPDPIYLKRSVQIAKILLSAFKSPSGMIFRVLVYTMRCHIIMNESTLTPGCFPINLGIPYSSLNLKERVGIPDEEFKGLSTVSEAASVQLEFKYLSYLTGDPQYWEAADKVSTHGRLTRSVLCATVRQNTAVPRNVLT